ncbi:MAG: hypothetical protein ACI8XO_001198 [Verrucomicrobiales bacterium]|jgi:hypothetical protein
MSTDSGDSGALRKWEIRLIPALPEGKIMLKVLPRAPEDSFSFGMAKRSVPSLDFWSVNPVRNFNQSIDES